MEILFIITSTIKSYLIHKMPIIIITNIYELNNIPVKDQIILFYIYCRIFKTLQQIKIKHMAPTYITTYIMLKS